MLWRARHWEFAFPRPILVMGIVNVTPDSFSDGGQFLDPDRAIAHARQLVREGADILDIGGESTRPGAAPVPVEEELRRVMPVIEAVCHELNVPVSIDTRKPAVARAALAAGACIVNDVGAAQADPEMARTVAEFEAGYVLMHMQGTPETMQIAPAYEDVVAEVGAFFESHLARLEGLGVGREQVALDVGIGFGKLPEHNLQLLAALAGFRKFQRPLLLGASRKSFIGQVTGEPAATQRLGGSLACACWAVQAGVQIVRVHDVAATRQAVRMWEAIQACTKS